MYDFARAVSWQHGVDPRIIDDLPWRDVEAFLVLVAETETVDHTQLDGD